MGRRARSSFMNRILGRRPRWDDTVQVSPSATVSKDSTLGAYTYVGHRSFVGRAAVGRYVSIGNNVSIGMGEHDVRRISTSSLFYDDAYAELTKAPCIVGDDVWIGVDAIVRRGVTVGLGAVIGANSFVNRDVPDFAIVAGSPARVVGMRFDEALQARIRESRWWEKDREAAAVIIARLEAERIHDA